MNQNQSLYSIFITFLKFGFLAWGGPVAQIAMIKSELIDNQRWITPEKFRRVLALYQALPGPEAHELCVYLGMIKAGRWGGFLAGLGFMLPGLCLMLLLSWAYVNLGAVALLPFFVGVAPAVTALIVRAVHRISEHILISRSLWVAAIVAAALTWASVHFTIIFFICALWHYLWSSERKHGAIAVLIASVIVAISATIFITLPSFALFSAGDNLLIEGLKAGLLSFGGAYTAIPFLHNSMVDVYPNITQQTFLDGIALGSVIPAPLIIFATYLGFNANGMTGALLMTLGVFFPAFCFTLLGHNYLEKLIENPTIHALLDGISAAVVGVLLVSMVDIFYHSITSWQQGILFILALTILYTIKKNWCIPLAIFVCGVLGVMLLQ
jgi:chromate transporter